MRAYVKRVIDKHHFICETRRKKQHKTPKSSAERKGLKGQVRMAAKAACLNEI